MFNTLLSNFTRTELIADSIFLACLVFAWYVPLFADAIFSPIERLGIRLSDRRAWAIAGIALIAIVVRLSLLHWLAIPIPQIHDEFSYLLAADTFAHGRLTNPPHPLWMFFETVHVNQHPTYMSKYPPAQGAVLALGQLMGNPWIGVLLSAAAMCAAALWMLQGWLPPRWALLGGVLVLLRLGIFTYWMNSYWGGAVPMIGGALVVGALPRIFRRTRWQDAMILGLGAALLANSRPWEGLCLCLPVIVALVAWIFRGHGGSWRITWTQLALPLCGVALIAGTFIAYYNWRNTGHPLLFPYALNEQTYSSTPVFIWQNARAPLHYLNPQFEYFYNSWERGYWAYYRVNSFETALRHFLLVTPAFVFFFMWPELCVPLLVLPRLLNDRKIRFLLVQAGVCFVGSYSVVWFLPHYASPATPTVFALLTQALRYLRHWKFQGRPVGIGLSRTIVLFAVLLAPFHQRASSIYPPPPEIAYRADLAADLSRLPGDHLVIVRYPQDRDTGEWVYNQADIDHAKVIWAREIPGISSDALIERFKSRTVWLVEPGASPIVLKPYAPGLASR